MKDFHEILHELFGFERFLASMAEHRLLKITDGLSVSLNLTVRDRRGEVLDDLYARSPLLIHFPDSRMPTGFNEGLRGMIAGQTRVFELCPEKAFGVRQACKLRRVHASELPMRPDKVGVGFRRLSPEGLSRKYIVQGFLDDWVLLDENHPWAGKTLVFEVTVLDVAPGKAAAMILKP